MPNASATLRVLGTSLDAENGPHFRILSDAGSKCEVVDRSLDLWQPDQLIRALNGIDAVIAGSEPYPAEVLCACPQLRVISRTGVGYDAIDLPTADELGVVIATTPGVNHHSVAEHTIAMLMALARGFPRLDQQVRVGVWDRRALPRVAGSTLGIVGLGRIGRATATRGVGLGMKVIASEPFPDAQFVEQYNIRICSTDDLLRESDYVSLHAPMSGENHHLINERTLKMMKSTCILINTARGPLIDENALIDALKTGGIRGAGLDVYEEEPLSTDSPLVAMDNVILSGHVAGMDCESHEDTYTMAAQTILTLHAGGWPTECIRNLSGVADWKW